ncbi:MAG: CHASE2 domain-containing protein, partial [Pyrinomonadaceae bacterium]|nr:CHASE2 domain-containing protein [Pyrinomonadaceae bacterium]
MARKKTRRNSKPTQTENAGTKKRVSPKSAEAESKISWQRRVLKTLPLMLLALLITFIISRSGRLNEWQTISLDTQMRLDMPDEESDVVVVDITQQDFEQIFAGQTRPLNPDALQRVIAAIAKGQPCVIGVDIDTSFPQFANFKVSENMSNVVWSRETAEIPENINEKAVPLDVLGGQNPEYNKKSGIPFLIDDAKKVPRFYTRLIKTTEGDLPSFAWAIFKEGKSRNCANLNFPDLEETQDQFIIGYSRGKKGAGRTRITASNILKFSE